MSKCHCESAPWLTTLISDEWWRALVCRDRDCRVSCGNPSIRGLADRRQQQSTFRFWGNRIDIDFNRFAKWIDSNHESECSYTAVWRHNEKLHNIKVDFYMCNIIQWLWLRASRPETANSDTCMTAPHSGVTKQGAVLSQRNRATPL